MAQYYNSTAGRLIDFGSVLGLVPGWSPNASQNFKDISSLVALKYAGLTTMAAGLSKWDVVTIQTINTTTAIGSSAGGGLWVGLKALGKAAAVGTFYATGLDILAHAGCDAVARQQSGQMTPTPVSGGGIP